MDAAMEVIFHIVITVAAVIGVAMRLERRLTKIETELERLKRDINNVSKKE